MLTDRERYLLLNLIPGIGSTRLRRLLEAFGTLDRLWQASGQELQQVDGIGGELARRIVAGCQDAQALEQELDLASRAGVAIVTLEETDYPSLLKELADPPPVLYSLGTLPREEVAVAIVGARRASLYGLQTAERLGYDLALRGVTVVSGLARGIDGAAHRRALKATGRTLAVLGNGLSRIYPPEHEKLAEEIVATNGAVISEYPMRMAPLAQNFPRRNRLISGLSRGVVIVEAAKRSGALITADCGLEQGREVFAVPGQVSAITSQGTHQLLKQGARLVTDVEDILEELRLDVRTPVPRVRQEQHVEPHPAIGRGGTFSCAHGAEPRTNLANGGTGARVDGLTDEEQAVLACLHADEPTDLDALAATTGLSIPTCMAALLRLELKRVVRQLPGKRFIRKTLEAMTT